MRIAIIFSFALLIVGCNRAAQPVVNSNAPAPAHNDRAQTAIAHSTENQTPKPLSGTGGKWTQSGDPIDTSKFDETIAKDEKAVKANASDQAAKEALGQAYFDRGFALTQARQYASALGDYRRALKYDPNHEDAKKWMEQILTIYGTLKKEAPPEGEEPPPLPFKKEA